MSRWERKDRVGEPLPLTGSFAAVGILSQSVHDAQPVCSDWDLRNEVSFALIRQSDPIGSDGPEDVWLYNRSVELHIKEDHHPSEQRKTYEEVICHLENVAHFSGTRPLFISMTASSSKPDTLRRLSPGYCIRVHKGEATASAPASERALQLHRRMSS
ncbi:hypothetical protein OSTOST_10178, partial [Ostertagia ostertagi]